MNNLILEKNKFGLRVYCPICVKHYNDKTIRGCNHPERQTYKSLVYIAGCTKVKHHKTNDFEEALMLAIQFRKEVKNGSLSNPLINNIHKNEGEISVEEAAMLFYKFKRGIDVPVYVKRNQEKHVNATIKYVDQFLDVLKTRGLNLRTMPLISLNENHVSAWVEVVRAHYGKGSWNAPLRALRHWINHMNDRHRMNMYNLFRNVPFEKTQNKVEAITKEEFDAVCNAVETKTPFEYLNGKEYKKNRKKPYLVDAFKMALMTGLRREEYLSLSWNDIIYNKEMDVHMIVTDNLKVERMTGEKCEPKYVPIHEDLSKLLTELGWNELKNTERRIIDPLGKESIQTMISCCTKGFTHFYKQAYPNVPNKTLNVLRKTYLSYLGKELGEDTVIFSSHKGMRVLEKHYFDKKIVTKGFDMKIFN